MDEFRELVRAYTADRGGVARLGRLSGINPSLISRWRDGGIKSRPTPENLKRVAPHLGLSYDEAAAMCGYPTATGESETEIEILRIAEEMRPVLSLFPRENWGWVVTKLGSLLQAIAPETEEAASAPEISKQPGRAISKRVRPTSGGSSGPDGKINAYQQPAALRLALR